MGDCCIPSPSNHSHLRCDICECYSFNISTSTQRLSCPSGYELNIEENSCREIDECLEFNMTCGDLICTNIPGSYECSTKAAIYYSPTKAALYAYRSYLTPHNTSSVLKCYKVADTFYKRYAPIGEDNLKGVGFAYDPYNQFLIMCGGGYSSYGGSEQTTTYCSRYIFHNGNFTVKLYDFIYSLQHSRKNFGIEFIDNLFYCFGGNYVDKGWNYETSYIRSDCEAFDVYDTWEDFGKHEINSLPEGLAYMCTVVVRGYEVYLIGGLGDLGTSIGLRKEKSVYVLILSLLQDLLKKFTFTTHTTRNIA